MRKSQEILFCPRETYVYLAEGFSKTENLTRGQYSGFSDESYRDELYAECWQYWETRTWQGHPG